MPPCWLDSLTAAQRQCCPSPWGTRTQLGGTVSLCQLCWVLQRVGQEVLLPCPAPSPPASLLPTQGHLSEAHTSLHREAWVTLTQLRQMWLNKRTYAIQLQTGDKKYNAYIEPSRSEAQELPVGSGLSNLTVHISSPARGEGELASS